VGRIAVLRQIPSISLIPPKALVVVDAGLGTIIDDKGMFWHNGGNVGFRSLYVGDPVSGNGMAAISWLEYDLRHTGSCRVWVVLRRF